MGVDLVAAGPEFEGPVRLDVVFHDGFRWLATGGLVTPEGTSGEIGFPVFNWECPWFPDYCEGVIWQSLDGSTWERAVALGLGAYVWDLAKDESVTVAVGSATARDGTGTPAAWVALDGDDWIRVEGSGPAGKGPIEAVASDGARFVAVGSTCSGQACRDIVFDGTPTVWMSDDGLSWEQTAVFNETTGVIYDVIYTGQQWVAVGNTGNPVAATAWASTDGHSWTQAAMPARANPAYNWKLDEGVTSPSEECLTEAYELAVSSEGRLVASGVCIPEGVSWVHSTVWYSDDGLEWIQVPDPEAAFAEPGGISGAVHTGSGFLLAGYQLYEPAADERPKVWASPDGIAWSPLATEINGGFGAIAFGDGTILAVGTGPESALITKITR
jgi:hypothetical protein